jgi:hypothetical protein
MKERQAATTPGRLELYSAIPNPMSNNPCPASYIPPSAFITYHSFRLSTPFFNPKSAIQTQNRMRLLPPPVFAFLPAPDIY